MNYIGSKAKLIPFIESSISSLVGKNFTSKNFCDLFAGSGCVGSHFAQKGCCIISNDVEYYSYVLNRALLQTPLLEDVEEIIASLNALPVQKGFMTKHYCASGGRLYFSDENAQKIDTLRQGIELYRKDETLYFFLLASLLHSVDKVANTASVYSAFLKYLKPLAQEPLRLEAFVYTPYEKHHQVFCEDANALISSIEGDILYLDPPYNRRQYGANYHILNTIAHYDHFKPKGKTGVRTYQSSAYCKEKTALQALEHLVREARFSSIFISYNDEGLISQKNIAKMLHQYGHYQQEKFLHQRFKSYRNILQKHRVYEYIHMLEKF